MPAARSSSRRDAAAYVCCSCLANADVEEDYSDSGRSPVRARRVALRRAAAVIFTCDPRWLSGLSPGVAEAPAEPGLALRPCGDRLKRVGANVVPICLRRPLAGEQALVVARDIDVICDALADYEPETPGRPRPAVAELRAPAPARLRSRARARARARACVRRTSRRSWKPPMTFRWPDSRIRGARGRQQARMAFIVEGRSRGFSGAAICIGVGGRRVVILGRRGRRRGGAAALRITNDQSGALPAAKGVGSACADRGEGQGCGVTFGGAAGIYPRAAVNDDACRRRASASAGRTSRRGGSLASQHTRKHGADRSTARTCRSRRAAERLAARAARAAPRRAPPATRGTSLEVPQLVSDLVAGVVVVRLG